MILDASHIFLVLLQQQHVWKKYFKENKKKHIKAIFFRQFDYMSHFFVHLQNM